MKYLYKLFLINTLIIFFLSSCSNNTSTHKEHETSIHDEKNHKHDDDNHRESLKDVHNHEEEQNETHNEVHLTKAQIQAIGIELGSFSQVKINDFISTTGTLNLPPYAYTSVTAKSSGIITGNKKFVEGNRIKKGTLIAFVENPDFIVKQQDYLEAKALLKLAKLNLERQQTLVNANAGISKNLQKAQAEVSVLEAKTSGLAKQLTFLGISPKKLTAQTIKQQIAIIAPASGYITKVNMHKGMYATTTTSLMEIISDDHLHLELDVFEKDITKIKIGQKISYAIPALGTDIYEGEVSIMGREFNNQNKTVRIHGHLTGKRPLFFKELYINAKIWLDDSTIKALPDEAIINDGENSFVYVLETTENDESVFDKILVKVQSSNAGYTGIEPLQEITKDAKIVVKGAYYIYAQSKNGALKHEH